MVGVPSVGGEDPIHQCTIPEKDPSCLELEKHPQLFAYLLQNWAEPKSPQHFQPKHTETADNPHPGSQTVWLSSSSSSNLECHFPLYRMFSDLQLILFLASPCEIYRNKFYPFLSHFTDKESVTQNIYVTI